MLKPSLSPDYYSQDEPSVELNEFPLLIESAVSAGTEDKSQIQPPLLQPVDQPVIYPVASYFSDGIESTMTAHAIHPGERIGLSRSIPLIVACVVVVIGIGVLGLCNLHGAMKRRRAGYTRARQEDVEEDIVTDIGSMPSTTNYEANQMIK